MNSWPNVLHANLHKNSIVTWMGFAKCPPCKSTQKSNSDMDGIRTEIYAHGKRGLSHSLWTTRLPPLWLKKQYPLNHVSVGNVTGRGALSAWPAIKGPNGAVFSYFMQPTTVDPSPHYQHGNAWGFTWISKDPRRTDDGSVALHGSVAATSVSISCRDPLLFCTILSVSSRSSVPTLLQDEHD